MITQANHTAAPSLRIIRQAAGRVLRVKEDGTVYVCRHLRIFSTDDQGENWREIARLPDPGMRSAVEWSRLATRLLRHEIRAVAILPDGGVVACDRRGLYVGAVGQVVLDPARVESSRGSGAAPPMTLTVGPAGEVLWGEYKSGRGDANSIRVFVSRDAGRTFEVAHVFEPGQIRHVHNIIYDAGLEKYWLLAGDHDHEPGIGLLSRDFRDFHWVVKGEQRFRAVELFDFGDHIVYGTDTEKEPNAVMRLDKKSGRVERLAELDGSCIYASRFGQVYALSTSIEPSVVNRSRHSGLWLSTDGDQWRRALTARKDAWHATYFQFGSIVLPRGASSKPTIFFSGQAVREFDGRVVVASLCE